MYKIKEKPEDFIVKEEMKLDLKDSGKVILFKLTKKGWNTLNAILEIAKRTGVSTGNFNVAGNKDKYAVTSQYVSVSGVSKERLESLSIKDISIEVLGYGDHRLALGDLSGNHFKIVVRNLDNDKIRVLDSIPNYFDDQRFGGGLRGNNATVGKLLVLKKYEEAMKTYLGKPFRREMKQEREFRKFVDENWEDWEGALEKCPKHLVHEREILEYLLDHHKDYVGAFNRLNKKVLSMFIHAYQSLLWNQVVSEYLRTKGEYYEVPYSQGKLVFSEMKQENIKIPIIGFLTEFNNPDIEKIYSKVLSKEGISFKDFINKQIRYLSSEGVNRDAFIPVKDLKYKFSSDEKFLNKKKCVLEFSLGKGSYGSLVVKGLFS